MAFLTSTKSRGLKAIAGSALCAALSACTVETVSNASGPITQLPEQVAALAGPNQDLSVVRLNPDDNCYWYQYAGPVETTMLPLRTRQGRPICVEAEEAAA